MNLRRSAADGQLTIGVAGHRDLIEDDLPRLAIEVRKIFVQLQTEYPAKVLVLMSSLAEGADRLVAQVFLDLKAESKNDTAFQLVVPLPLPREEFEQDFAQGRSLYPSGPAASLSEFRRLVAQANECFVVPAPEVTETNAAGSSGRGIYYEQAARYVALYSQLLVALWNGIETGKQGGTDLSVRLMREGGSPPSGALRSTLEAPAPALVYHLITRRQSDPRTSGELFSLRVLAAGHSGST